MGKKILSAFVLDLEGKHTQKLRFGSQINILWGQDAEDVFWTLAGVLGGMPPKNGKVEIQWDADASLFIFVKDGACGVERAEPQHMNIAQLVKDYHKYRFLHFKNRTHILDGSDIPAGFSGASDLLQKKLRDTPATEDGCPLFICNFLERLDEAADLKSVFEILTATGQQVFIAVPHYYNMKQLEEMPYDIHTL